MPPIHPAFVHIPLALLPTAVLLATWAAWKDAHWARRAARVLLALGLLGALAAVLSGVLEEDAAVGVVDAAAMAAIQRHKLVALVATGVFALLTGWLWWRPTTLTTRRHAIAFLVAGWLGVALILLAGYLGGEVVYVHGVGVDAQG